MNNNSEELDLLEIARVIMSKILIIILSGVLVGTIAFVYSYGFKTPMYTSTTSIYILNKNDSNAAISYNDTLLSSQISKDYQKMITSRVVLEAVIDKCDIADIMTTNELASRINVVQDGDTRIIKISVKDANPENAQILTDLVRDEAAVRIKEITNVEAVNTVDPADKPVNPSEPNVKRTTVIGFLIGFILATGIVVVIYLLDDTIKSEDDIEKYLGLSTLAMIPERNTDSSGSRKRKKSRKGQGR